MTKPRYRLAHDAALIKGADVCLRDNAAHYLTQVLRLKTGDSVALFNRTHGEWRAVVEDIRKKEVVLRIEEGLRAAEPAQFSLTVCFAPIKGGRMETILEKATELGASVLQPVITQRTIVDKVNLERAEAIAREAAEQCERLDWPQLREPVKLLKLLGDWPKDLPLIYGDESGESESILRLTNETPACALAPYPSPIGGRDGRGPTQARDSGEPSVCVSPHPALPPMGEGVWSQPVVHGSIPGWAILTGPEGGFAPEELVALRHLKAARGVSLGPRILRADTAVITLCAATLMAWGDWDKRPRFTGE